MNDMEVMKNDQGKTPAAGTLEALRAFCQDLAEQVRAETLSRWSMQQTLRTRFPQFSEADLAREMQDALKILPGEE
ncbi:MAG TPA: hypothetical protein VE954_32405, partial [Oligoflexus sp.]|uniref:hypothetical protein n=1 Tax=Oligoflexus sp. TaxID=1971216 RepID=UPI002D4EBA84